TWRSNSAGRRISSIGSRHSRLIWYTGRGPRSLAKIPPCARPGLPPRPYPSCSSAAAVPLQTGSSPTSDRLAALYPARAFPGTPLQPKRRALLHELVPQPATIAWLRNPSNPGFEIEERDVDSAARELGRHLLSLDAESPREIDAAFATMVQSRAGALLIGSGV